MDVDDEASWGHDEVSYHEAAVGAQPVRRALEVPSLPCCSPFSVLLLLHRILTGERRKVPARGNPRYQVPYIDDATRGSPRYVS